MLTAVRSAVTGGRDLERYRPSRFKANTESFPGEVWSAYRHDDF